jgi:hypothetical protein
MTDKEKEPVKLKGCPNKGSPCTCPDDSWSLREVSLFCPVHGDEYADAIRGHLDASGYKSNITVEIIKK